MGAYLRRLVVHMSIPPLSLSPSLTLCLWPEGGREVEPDSIN